MKWGHFASLRWQHGDRQLPEVLVSGEGLKRSPAEILVTLLHEAAHGLADVRGIQDTSRQGRWHNKKFGKNPCSAKSVDKPRPNERKIVPWTLDQVRAVRAAIPARYQPMVDLGSACGMRQGEILGLAVDDIDFADGWITVRQQVKRVRSRLVFGLPKNNKERRIPLSDAIADILAQHIIDVPPRSVTLPWEDPDNDKRVTVTLLFTTTRKNAINRSHFNPDFWHPAVKQAGLDRSRDNGMHALRHFYASALLDAGETIKAVAAYLGHADPGFTLRTYTHLMPASEERTRAAIDALFGKPKKAPTPSTRPGRTWRRRFRRSRAT
ncbi:tyrosine-type recombinase/integrase [Actinoplanes flavus]|nr:site-specific integrase [Actinoplanes flavus]